MNNTISYSKLSDGTWGVRGPAAMLIPGRVVTVEKRDGTKKDATVRGVLEVRGGVATATIEADYAGSRSRGEVATATIETNRPSPPALRRRNGLGLGRRTGCRCGSQEGGSKPSDCGTCKHDAD